MCVVDVPHFKEVVLMCTSCDQCGYVSREVAGGSGGPVSRRGTRITLTVRGEDDLKRDVVKSGTADISIPELEVEVEGGGGGGSSGVYSTVEGLLRGMHERLRQAYPNEESPDRSRFAAFLDRLRGMADGTILPFTVIITDPLSNSFIAGPQSTESATCSMTVEEFDRTDEQNVRLGLK